MRHMLTRPTPSVWATAERMSCSSAWKPPRGSVCRAVSSVRTALWCLEPLLAGLQRLFGGQLLGDVAEHGDHGRLAADADHAGVGVHPQRLAVAALEVQPHAVGAEVTADNFRQALARRRIDVVLEHQLTLRLVLRHAEELRRILIDRQNGVVSAAA